MQEFLRYLVETDLAGRGESLGSLNIAMNVFGRDEKFDPNQDSIVRVEAARLRRLLETHYATNPGSAVRISIPKGRYLPSYEALQQPARPRLNRPIGGPGIAVLPFFATPTSQLLADGLAAELRFQLSRFAEFRVVDATSMAAVPAVELLARVDHELQCQFLVQGRISSGKTGPRVAVEAINTANAQVMWSDRLEVSAAETAEEQLATTIARALAPAPGSLIVSGFERGDRPPRDWDALDCVLHWHYYRIHSRSQQTFNALQSALKILLDKHPNFALGWAILGYMTVDGWMYRMQPNATFNDLGRDARTYAGRALSLMPRNAPAHYVMGLCDYFGGDYTGFRAHFEKAVDLNPNSLDLLHHGGTLLAFGGDWNAGRKIVLDANLGYSNTMGLQFFYIVNALRTGNLKKADDLLKVIKPHGAWYWGYLLRAVIAEKQDKLEDARASLKMAFADCPELARELAQEVTKWFGDSQARRLFDESFQRIEQSML